MAVLSPKRQCRTLPNDMHRLGLEPKSEWLRATCNRHYTNGAYSILVPLEGFEPSPDGLKVHCAIPLNTTEA